MLRKIVHPWWGHLPAALGLMGFVIYSLSGVRSWPARMPLSTTWRGEPNMWGSPWIGFAIVVGLGLAFMSVSTIMDEMWARQEGRKRFNVFALLDEALIGWLGGTQLAMVAAISQGASTIPYPWGAALLGATILAGGAAALESQRSFVPGPSLPVETQPEAFARAIQERVARGERVVYWDIQNPRYVTVLSLGLPVILWIGAGFAMGQILWPGIILVLCGASMLCFYGGLRTRVTNEEVTVRYGLLGIRIFRCQTGEIESLRLREFAALREFGGYGIRVSGSTVGFFLSGSRGVDIGRGRKRSALIGSDRPKRLAAVLAAVTGIEPTAYDAGNEAGRIDG